MDKGDYEKTLGKRPAQETPKFDEAPGEEEANAVRDAFLNNVSKQPASTPQALSTVDSSTRASAVKRLQQQQGNTYVKRVVAEGPGRSGKSGRLVGLSQSDMVSEVQQRKGSGSELPGETRKTMESQFGENLSGVRVHTGSESVALNRELNAQAFTVGSDIFMGEGKYNPSSSEGQGLLAHELTHVGQQTGFVSAGVQRQGMPEEEQPEMAQRQAEDEDQEEKT